jgi:cytochrome c oxidase assembly protein subunit 15
VNATLALESAAKSPGHWPRRWALATVLAAVPLVLFGGSVTTLGAGMAVDGWLIAEGHFLLFFPVEEWLRDTPTFVEHTHRLFGVLVGFFALACAAATWLGQSPGSARKSALVALGAVCAQGALGGARVLLDDAGLAFVHGVSAQLVFALLCANAVVLSQAWRDPLAPAWAGDQPAGLLRPALTAWLATVLQVGLGAWYRHGLRPAPGADSGLRFLLHGLGALVVLASAAALVRRASPLREQSAVPPSLALALRALPVVLLVQLVLGGLAWAGFRPGAIGPAEWGLSIAHVLGGAVLLAAMTIISLWSARLSRVGRVR